MTRRVEVQHKTVFVYADEVRRSISELRLEPVDSPGQTVERFEIATEPASRLLVHVDGFGTRVTTLYSERPHRRLEIFVSSVVVLHMNEEPPDGDWGEVVRPDAVDWRLMTPRTTLPPETVEPVCDLRAEAQTPKSLVEDAGRWLAGALAYDPGATHVGSDLREVFGRRAGVCQDYAHALVAMLRSAGLPARYASGYLMSGSDTIETGGHAWTEVLVGDAWYGYDPVHTSWVQDRHVRVAAGRDYDDVVPVRGVFEGPADHELGVEVRVRELAPRA